jgi:ATP-binding cassette subfamily F protein uup
MDKVVDHLLVFKGNGVIKDFPGNYTQYREWKKIEPEPEEPKKGEATNTVSQRSSGPRDPNANKKRKMTFKEKREFESLEKELETLNTEKKNIEEKLSGSNITVEEITTLSKRLPILNNEIDEKELRWLELSEIEG